MRKMKTRFIGMREFRKDMSKILKEAQKRHFQIILLRHAKPIVRITPLSKKERELEELAWDVAVARKESKRGEGVPSEKIEKEFGLR